MRRLVVFSVRALAVLSLILVAAAACGYLYVRQSLPVVNGEVVVSGIAGPVEIVRDTDAVPHIFATTKLDALYGLGYVHAQDRLWQMEFQRRIGHGRLSEVFGAATIAQDRFLRTVGFGRAAADAWSHLPGDSRRQIEAYVAGVNAFISTHRGRRLPPEFTLLRFEPEPFTGIDVVVWVKMMAWDLSANYSLELMRHDMAARVGDERMKALLPPYPVDGLSVVPALPSVLPPNVATGRQRRVDGASAQAAATLPGARLSSDDAVSLLAASLAGGQPAVRDLLLGGTEALGSNSWVGDGTLTATGKPMLANDPHLGTKVPSLWYLAHLSAGDFDVIGATLPGAPAVAIGRNRFIAWGETNVAADVEDLVLERIGPSGTTVEYQGAQEPLRIVPETIVVKGEDPVHLDVRITRHGPLVSDAINANNAESNASSRPPVLEPLAFQWTALAQSDSTVAAFLQLNEARNWSDFTRALQDFVVPSQNFVYADVNGHIGYYAPGRIPVRQTGDGSQPVPGWTGEAEWTRWIPFDELPHAFDPPEHFIVTANNRPMPAAYPHFIALEYPEPYRAQRITDLLKDKRALTPNDFRDIQADGRSLHARALLPVLLPLAKPEGALGQRALDALKQWNFDASPDSAAEAIFQAWFLQLPKVILGDDLGSQALRSYEGRFTYITRFLMATLPSGSSPWCDDMHTPAPETCGEAVTTALNLGLEDLERRMGGDMDRWRWDLVHIVKFPHQGLDAVGLLRPILSRSMPNGGDWSTVNVGPVAAASPYDQISIPGYRQIVDLSPANDSRFLDAVGQSGHVLSPHYDDFLTDWSAVRHKKMRMEREDIAVGALGTLRLMPSR
jgi:penicillin amidase